MLLHDTQELDDDLGARSDEDLSLAGLLGVVERVERIVENGSLDHFGGVWIELLDSHEGEKKKKRKERKERKEMYSTVVFLLKIV